LYSIIWGKDGKSFKSKKYLYRNNYGPHVPRIYSKNYLGSEISCGTSCYYCLFLSMDGKVDKELFYCLAYNLKLDLAVYVEEDDYYGTFVILNLRTNRKIKFRLPGIGNDDDCYTSYYAVDKARFEGKKLIMYYPEKDFKGDSKTKKITIDCDLLNPQDDLHSYSPEQTRADTLVHYLDKNHNIFYRIKIEDDSLYSIIWGKNGKSFKSKKYRYDEESIAHVPVVMPNNYLVSKVKHGTWDANTLFLSMDGKVDKELLNCIAYCLKYNLVAYIDYTEDIPKFIVENLRTNRKLQFKLPDECNSGGTYLNNSRYDKALFNGRKFIIYYNESNGFYNKNKKMVIDCDLE
jgi:hypothetical protein